MATPELRHMLRDDDLNHEEQKQVLELAIKFHKNRFYHQPFAGRCRCLGTSEVFLQARTWRRKLQVFSGRAVGALESFNRRSFFAKPRNPRIFAA